jgi:hypothetical protein
MSFFAEIETSILKFMWRNKRDQISKTVLRKKNNAEGITVPQIILQSHSSKKSMILAQKQRPMEQKRRPRNKTIKPWSSDV